MWRTIKTKPNEDGLFMGAQFEDGRLVGYAYYAYLGYWMPNTVGCGVDKLTHWMPIREFRALLEGAPIMNEQ